MGQRLLQAAARIRLVAAEIASRRLAVGTGQHQGRGHAGRCRGSVDPSQADHDRRRHGDEVRPRIPQDRRTLPQGPGLFLAGVRARLVQADAPRHGTEGALHRPRRTEGRPHLAGPGPRGAYRLRRGCPEGGDCRQRSVHRRYGLHRMGQRPYLPWLRQARRRQRSAHPSRAAEELGGQRTAAPGQGAGGIREDCRRVRRQHCRCDRAGGQPRYRAGRQGRGLRHHGAVRARPR